MIRRFTIKTKSCDRSHDLAKKILERLLALNLGRAEG